MNWSIPRERRQQVGFGLVVATTPGMALAVGGAHPGAFLAGAFVALFGVVLLFPRKSSRQVPAPVLLTYGLVGYTLIQIVPLPLSVLGWLSPKAADIWSRALLPFGEAVRWGSLSLDPGATLREAMKWLLYALVLRVAILAVARRGRLAAVLVVFISALVVCFATLVHQLLSLERVFWLYDPVFGRASQGPLLNSNNLASYVNLGGFAGLGLAMSKRLRRERWLISLGVAMLFGTTVLSGSRAGVGLLVLGLALFALLVAVDRRHEAASLETRTWRAWSVLVATVASAVLFAALAAGRATWNALLEDNAEKLMMVKWAMPMIADFPIFGVGRGAFESAFSAYAPPVSNGIFSHPENVVVQWISEWGLPVGVLALGGYAWVLRPQRLRVFGSSATIGILVGAVTLMLHNLVDLGLEVPALPLLLSWALAALWKAPKSSPARARSPRVPHWIRLRWVAVAVSGGTLWGAAALKGGSSVLLEREAIRDWVGSASLDGESTSRVFDRLRVLMRNHPAEPYFPRLGAGLAVAVGDPSAILWVERALELWPQDAGTHVLIARALAQRGAVKQALFELRYAAELDPATARLVGQWGARWADNWDDLLRCVPPGPTGADVFAAAGREWLKSGTEDLGLKSLRAAVSRDGTDVTARRSLAQALLRSVEKGTCPVVEECGEEALKHARLLDSQMPTSASPVALRARVLSALGRRGEAESLLRRRCNALKGDESVACLRQLLLLLRRSSAPSSSDIGSAAEMLVRVACSAGGECATELIEAGDAQVQVRNFVAAYKLYQHATYEAPNARSYMKLADVASRLHRIRQAEAALQRAERLAGDDGALRRQIVRIRLENAKRVTRASSE